jgi:mRNA interferase RelE/StbE
MVWRIEFSPLAEKNLAQLDRQIAQRLLRFLHEGVAPLKNPRQIGEALKGSKLGDFWKYRVGDYRIIAISTMALYASLWFVSAIDATSIDKSRAAEPRFGGLPR